MFGVVKMFGSVFVLRGIAAAHVSADQAQTQVDPLIAHFQAFFAAFGVRLNVLDLVQMCALAHRSLMISHREAGCVFATPRDARLQLGELLFEKTTQIACQL